MKTNPTICFKKKGTLKAPASAKVQISFENGRKLDQVILQHFLAVPKPKPESESKKVVCQVSAWSEISFNVNRTAPWKSYLPQAIIDIIHERQNFSIPKKGEASPERRGTFSRRDIPPGLSVEGTANAEGDGFGVLRSAPFRLRFFQIFFAFCLRRKSSYLRSSPFSW